MSDPALIRDPIIEAAARAMCEGRQFLKGWDDTNEGDREWYRDLARNALAAVTPLIRNAALEEAAVVAEEHDVDTNEAWEALDRIAAAIRALIVTSPSPPEPRA